MKRELNGNENANTMSVREILYAHQDLKYADFIAKLVPTLPKESFIGVRTPEYKKILKELPQEDVVREFMNDLPHQFYEENILHVTLIGKIKDFDDCLNQVERFLPYVDNWAVCDGLQPKVFKKHTEEIRKLIPGWITSEETYTRRFGLHMLMTYFLDDDFDEALLSLAADQRSEEYYANMMTAWAFAEALAKQWDVAVTYIEGKRLDKWTHNKAIQKAVESYKFTDEQKTYLKGLKVK